MSQSDNLKLKDFKSLFSFSQLLKIYLIQSMVQTFCKLFDDIDKSPFSHFRQRLFPLSSNKYFEIVHENINLTR